MNQFVSDSCPDKLIAHFQGAGNAARILKVDRQSIYQWEKKGFIPTFHALEVERVTQGKITIREILEEAEKISPPKILARQV